MRPARNSLPYSQVFRSQVQVPGTRSPGRGAHGYEREDLCGGDERSGYPRTPTGWQPRAGQFAIDDRHKTRVANYSGGYEDQYPLRTIRGAAGTGSVSLLWWPEFLGGAPYASSRQNMGSI